MVMQRSDYVMLFKRVADTVTPVNICNERARAHSYKQAFLANEIQRPRRESGHTRSLKQKQQSGLWSPRGLPFLSQPNRRYTAPGEKHQVQDKP